MNFDNTSLVIIRILLPEIPCRYISNAVKCKRFIIGQVSLAISAVYNCALFNTNTILLGPSKVWSIAIGCFAYVRRL